MTKADLVEKVAAAADLSKAEAEEVVRTVLESIVEALQRKEKIELRGFGSFRLRERRPRQGRNPKTGTKVFVPGKIVPYFKPGKELREMLNPQDAAQDGEGDGAPSPGTQSPGTSSHGAESGSGGTASDTPADRGSERPGTPSSWPLGGGDSA